MQVFALQPTAYKDATVRNPVLHARERGSHARPALQSRLLSRAASCGVWFVAVIRREAPVLGCRVRVSLGPRVVNANSVSPDSSLQKTGFRSDNDRGSQGTADQDLATVGEGRMANRCAAPHRCSFVSDAIREVLRPDHGGAMVLVSDPRLVPQIRISPWNPHSVGLWPPRSLGLDRSVRFCHSHDSEVHDIRGSHPQASVTEPVRARIVGQGADLSVFGNAATHVRHREEEDSSRSAEKGYCRRKLDVTILGVVLVVDHWVAVAGGSGVPTHSGLRERVNGTCVRALSPHLVYWQRLNGHARLQYTDVFGNSFWWARAGLRSRGSLFRAESPFGEEPGLLLML